MEKLTTIEMFQKTQSYGRTPDEAACFLYGKLRGQELRAQYLLERDGPNERFQRQVDEAQMQLDELAGIYPQLAERISVWETEAEAFAREFNEVVASKGR